jgi:hypothetical protein
VLGPDTDAYRRPACVTYRALFDPGSEQEKLQKPVVQRPVAPPPPFVPEISDDQEADLARLLG